MCIMCLCVSIQTHTHTHIHHKFRFNMFLCNCLRRWQIKINSCADLTFFLLYRIFIALEGQLKFTMSFFFDLFSFPRRDEILMDSRVQGKYLHWILKLSELVKYTYFPFQILFFLRFPLHNLCWLFTDYFMYQKRKFHNFKMDKDCLDLLFMGFIIQIYKDKIILSVNFRCSGLHQFFYFSHWTKSMPDFILSMKAHHFESESA